jgi:DNA-binding winged helix-turn-helix (wHTH) protein/tetratricopeptide (TPR) repeat protein
MESPRFFQFPRKEPAHPEPARVPEHYIFGPFTLDTDRHELTRSGERVSLPPKGFDLLCLFLRSDGGVLEKDRLMRALWPDTFVEEANLSNLIALLRKTLGDSPARSSYIHTVPKVGYRFVAPVNPAESKPVPVLAAPLHAGERSHSAIRIVVFPFRMNAGFREQEHLAYSLPEAISSSLAEINAFTVRSMQLAMSFDPVRWDPRSVGREAEVEYILAGAIGPGSTGISVSIQLMEAENGTLVWAQQWEIDAGQLATVHHAVIHHVVRRLVRGGVDADYSSAQTGIPGDSEAMRMYLLANQLMTKRDSENFALARDLYTACLERDPNFAPAWARLGRCYRWLEKFGPAETAGAHTAKAAFQHAFALNPNLVLAHSLYTPIEADAGQAENAMVRLLRRLRSHRNSPELFAALVHACRYCGQLEASLAAHRRALELDSRVRTSVAHTWFALGDYDRALFWYGNREGVYLDVLILAGSGREQESAALLSTRKDRFAMLPAGMHSLDAYLRGDRARGIEVLRGASADANIDPEMLFYLARQAARLEEIDLANELLSRSIDAGYWTTAALRGDPWLNPVRKTIRFRELLALAEDLEEKSHHAFVSAGGVEVLAMDAECAPNQSGELA